MELQRLELAAKIDHTVFADIESVVVEENFLHLGKVAERLFHFARHVFRRTRPPGMPRNGLWPHAEGTERRAAARGVERHVRMQQERHVIALDLQVALVNVRRERQRIQLFGVQLRALRVVNDLAVFAVADALNLAERLPVRVFHHRVIELPARHKINVFAGHHRFVRLDVPVRPHERNLHARVGFFDLADEPDVALEANRGSEENQKLIVLANLDGLLPIDFVGRSIEQPAAGNHPGRIRQPNWIPIRLNLTRRGPP